MKLDRGVLILAAVVLCFVWGLFFMFTLGVRFCGGSEEFGQMGDAFNMLNALFAGLAFAAICFQLWIQQTQIAAEQHARHRAERISALTTRIEVTFQKILYERNLLLKVAPGFENVSFLHEGDGIRIEESIDAKENLVISLNDLISAFENQATGGARADTNDVWKPLLDNQAAIPMMKQIKKWVDQLNSYEKEMDGLLKGNTDAKEAG
jgi:hypothetical protein